MIWLLACAPRVAEVGLPPEPGHVTILHTNDLHAHFLPEPADWLPGRPAIGGMERLDAEMDALRAARPRGSVLTLDAGDELTGTPLANLVVDGARGGAMNRFFQLLDYDAWAIGNHEFDKGVDALSAYVEHSPMETLSANVLDESGERPLFPQQAPSHVFERSGVRVGVIGVTTDQLKGLMSPVEFQKLRLETVEDSVREQVAALRGEVDVVVVLSHVGLEGDEALARYVKGIDVIVGGHSHTRMTTASRVQDTWIVQAGSYGRSLGVVDFAVEDGKVQDFHYELRDLTPETAPGAASREVTDQVRAYEAELEHEFGQVVSEAPATLGRSYNHESALGRWITDALRTAAGADVGLYNGGGLRADLEAGTVTRGDLFNCFPFENQVLVFDILGKDLQAIVLRNIIAENDEQRGFLPLSGVSWTWRVRNGAPELVDVKVGSSAIDLDHTYTVASTSFIVEQWERHIGVAPKNVRGIGMNDLEAAIRYAESGDVVDPGDLRAQRAK